MLRKKKKEICEDKPNYYSLPLGAINPKGYLKDEIELYIKNHISKINTSWKPLENNFWIGGKNEGGYLPLQYITNLVMLAYETDNDSLKAKIKPWVEGILATQKTNGDFGKEGETDWEEKIFALGVLATYYDATADNRVLDFVYNFCKYQFNEIDMLPPTANTMACLSIEFELLNYFYEETEKEFYLELKQKLVRFSYDFGEYFDKFEYKDETKKYLSKSTIYFKSNFIKKQTVDEDLEASEKVMKDNRDKNVKKYLLSLGRVVALNMPVLLERAKHSDSDETERTKKFVENLYNNHGLNNGCFSADNHLNGREMNGATDIETVANTLKSMLELEKLSTDNYYSSFADEIFYNVFPSMFFKDYTYVQGISGPNQLGLQTNDYYTANKKDNNFNAIISDSGMVASSNLFNHFVSSLAYETDDGLAFHHYAPCKIKVCLNNNFIEILESTNYPFDNKVNFEILLMDSDKEIEFRFAVPKYTSVNLLVNGEKVSSSASGVIKIKKLCSIGDVFTLDINNGLRATFNDDGSLTFRMGGLILCNPVNTNIVETKKGFVAESREDFRKAPVIKDNKLEIKSITKRADIATLYDYNKPFYTVKLVSDIAINWSKSATEYCSIPKNTKFGNSMDIITLVPYANTINRIMQFPYKVVETVKK